MIMNFDSSRLVTLPILMENTSMPLALMVCIIGSFWCQLLPKSSLCPNNVQGKFITYVGNYSDMLSIHVSSSLCQDVLNLSSYPMLFSHVVVEGIIIFFSFVGLLLSIVTYGFGRYN